MKNQSTIHDSNPGLHALAREYGGQLRDASHRLGLPDGYQLSPSVSDGDVFSLDVVAADSHGDLTFDKDIARGRLDTVLIAVHTVVNLAEASDAAMHDSLERADLQRATRETENAAHAAADWHSRFDGIAHPDLVSEHTPGWCDQDAGDPLNVSHFIFRSHNEEFGLDFDVLEDTPGPVSMGLLPSWCDCDVQTAEELLTLSNHTGRLQQWLDDCATVTAWIRQHDESEHNHE